MNKLLQFGEYVTEHKIPVLNEREIRASAGMMFLAMFVAFMFVIFNKEFLLIKYVIAVFFVDFTIRVLINPKFSPTLIIARLIVSKQTPEYVGAPQKKFAWTIGVVLSASMFIHMVIINSYSPVTGSICLICLVFLFFESAFGICLGCKFYPLIFKEKAKLCAGDICNPVHKHDIQKVSKAQLLVAFSFAVFLIVIALLFNEQFSKQPFELFGKNGIL